MIDAARALYEQTDREIARLQLLRESLEAFIDQPDPGKEPLTGAPAVGGPSDPVTGGEVGRARRRTSATQLPSIQPDENPGPDVLASTDLDLTPPSEAGPIYICSKCGRDDFQRPNTRAMHEKHCDGRGTQRLRPPRNPRSAAPLELEPLGARYAGQ